MAWVWELAGAVRGRKDRHTCGRAGLTSSGTNYRSNREPLCVLCSVLREESASLHGIQGWAVSGSKHPGGGAALTGFCTHCSIICKHSYLDQTKAFPVLSWARVRQHAWTEGFLSPLHEALWVLRDCALGFSTNESKTLYTCFWSFRSAAVSEMKWCALWSFVFLCILIS